MHTHASRRDGSEAHSITGGLFELRDLERFMAIVEHRTFGRAARVLGMTQPALSRRIAQLEKELGAKLFSRDRRQIELTPIGEVVVREGRAVLAQAWAADNAIRGAVRGAAQHLRCGIRSVARYRLIPDAVRRLRASHPDVTVTVTEPSLGAPIELLRQSAVDVGVMRGPLDLDREFSAKRLRTDAIVVALPERHPLSERDVVDVEMLAAESFVEVAPNYPSGYRDVARQVAVRAGFVPHVVQFFDMLDSVAICVAAGAGIALMHDASRELPLPGIVYRPLRPAGPNVDLQAVWRTDNANPAIEPFIAYLAAVAAYDDSPTPA